MKWIVIDTVIQPSCGISFSAIWSKIKLITWYQSDVFLPPESIFTLTHTGIVLNNKVLPVTIYNVVPFNKRFWDLIKNSQECPANSDNVLKECFNNHCILRKRKLTAVCSHQTRIGNLDAHLTQTGI